ncbi:tRNA (guanine(10)-N(2))-dimethyltransferase [Methanimicrococcus blatticola]|uniref:tRNA (guanine(26)-N(2))-dimethyltransferase n=1 Tax=Methanimicrococcus blatticola TaxID=91560 RepID=A0A484F655_9EURY|nr:tRNA (guanine(10)-N(2))-dimethyltransferase [Methanimicrococcus blatticola]MBZ3934902.1 tRNA (guanine(10)-N(2))-dimethyltransferase [Methanimicrococcus blatticola]MCC2508999.1 tRNA (guanine(10)-N(2))-dimethyltransferase [Methanimicrococcus blatticola]TDQ70973.1 N(2),N(2)-dimethylguanosine tRNA methyltransferase [Methanimicrococcus blatticola]
MTETYRLIKEGQTEVYVPTDNDPDVPSASASVFYNPAMEMNRDINVAVTSVYAKKLAERKGFDKSQITYADAFSASGIRGLRVSKEVGIAAVLNDWKEEAVSLIQKNIDYNNLQETVTATCMGADKLLHGQKFAIVDIDPFGTPAPFLDSAVSSASFFLGVTATDTAPLCGAHLKSGMRKYAAVPLNNEFHSEMGLRILIGSIARAASKFDKGIRPLFSHATRHYVRVYAEILNGAGNADKTLKELGFIAWCPQCKNMETKNGLAVFMNEECPVCGGKRKMSGPLWLGTFKDKDFCNDVISKLNSLPLNKKEEAIKLLTVCRDEADIPFFYDQHLLCEMLKISAPPMEPFLESVRKAGYIATRTHFSGTSFKTDASVEIILDILKNQS